MQKFILNPLRGVISGIMLFITMILCALAVIIFAPFRWIIPIKGWRHFMTWFLHQIPATWMTLNKAILHLFSHSKWDIQSNIEGNHKLSTKNTYVLLANHQTWVDILVLGYVFNRKTPLIKFFMKKELLWSLPLAGFACWFLDYPFMERHTREQIRKNPALKGKDIETSKQACEKFKLFPTTIMNFVEGTRFSPAKKEKQRSPYQHLLKPKVGALAVVLKEMDGHLSGILDATIAYSKPNLSFWQFLCGDFEKISFRYQLRPVTDNLIGDYYNDRAYRKDIQSWLNEVWQEKDAELEQLKL